MYNVVWYSLHKPEIIARGYWDQAMLEELFKDFTHSESLEELDGAIVVIPARHHYKDIDKINADLSHLSWVLLILTGDEEQVFPTDQLEHPKMIIWSMTPHLGKYKNIDRYLINGYPPKCREELQKYDGKKTEGFFFAGQVTHQAREDCLEELSKRNDGEAIATAGFTQGVGPEEYYEKLAKAKIAPAPSGPVIPDTFRLYEGLEAGCVPIAENKDYFDMLLGDYPFPVVSTWEQSQGIITNLVDRYPVMNNKVFAWWQRYKRQMQYRLEDDLMFLTGNLNIPAITVLIPTSPIASHPSTEIIDQTIASVREQLPGAEIILMIDGIRTEQEHYRKNYDEYTRRLLWKANTQWPNVFPLVFEEHQHQANMTREALKHVRTPYLVFVEHDTPLTGEIPWGEMCQVIQSGEANVIRLMHEAVMQPDHKHLMLEEEPFIIGNLRMMPTAQWSQRPHLATSDFYRYLIDKYTNPNQKTMIEDAVHGPVQNAYLQRQKEGWNEFKVWLYTPDGDMKRSLNLDGRGEDSKYEDTFGL